jgi:hypothetical protein
MGDLVHQTTANGADPGVRVEDEGQVGLGFGRVRRDSVRVSSDHDSLGVEYLRPVDPRARVDQLAHIGDHHMGSGGDPSPATLEIHGPRLENARQVERREGHPAVDDRIGLRDRHSRDRDLLDGAVAEEAKHDACARHGDLRSPQLAARKPARAPSPAAESTK